MSKEAIAILGIVNELPNRYHPAGLATSVGSERVGVAGWIIDQRLGVNAEPDEETIKLAIALLVEEKLIKITDWQRMEPTEKGRQVWNDCR